MERPRAPARLFSGPPAPGGRGAPQPRAGRYFQGGGVIAPGPCPLLPRPLTTGPFPAHALWKGRRQCQEQELFMTLASRLGSSVLFTRQGTEVLHWGFAVVLGSGFMTESINPKVSPRRSTQIIKAGRRGEEKVQAASGRRGEPQRIHGHSGEATRHLPWGRVPARAPGPEQTSCRNPVWSLSAPLIQILEGTPPHPGAPSKHQPMARISGSGERGGPQ